MILSQNMQDDINPYLERLFHDCKIMKSKVVWVVTQLIKPDVSGEYFHLQC
jgi:protoheme ferro-lyase